MMAPPTCSPTTTTPRSAGSGGAARASSGQRGLAGEAPRPPSHCSRLSAVKRHTAGRGVQWETMMPICRSRSGIVLLGLLLMASTAACNSDVAETTTTPAGAVGQATAPSPGARTTPIAAPATPGTGWAPGLEGAERCPTPLFPSRVQPPDVPLYPGAENKRARTVPRGTLTFMAGTYAHLEQVTLFTTTDPPAAVRTFYSAALHNEGWRMDPTTPLTSTLHFSWMVDTSPWQAPPCNATPETGLAIFLLDLKVLQNTTGTTDVELEQGYYPGI